METLNSSDFREDWNQEVGHMMIVNAVILAIYFLVGVTGNILVLVVYMTKLKKAPSERYFIPVLAVSDIFATTFGFINCLLLVVMQPNFTNDILCKYLYFTITISAAMSIFIFLSIALQRYLLICRRISIPLSVRRAMVGISIFLSVISAIPFLFNYGIIEYYSEGFFIGTRCGRLKRTNYAQGVGYAIFFISFLAFTVSALVFFYGCIGCVIFGQFKSKKSTSEVHRHERRSNNLDLDSAGGYISSSPTSITNETSKSCYVRGKFEVTDLKPVNATNQGTSHGGHVQIDHPLSKKSDAKLEKWGQNKMDTDNDKPVIRHNTHVRRRNRKVKIKFSLMFMIVTTVSLVCYCPVGVIVVLEGFDPDFWDNLSRREYLVVLWLYHTYIINSCVNPILYAFLDSEFYAALQSVLRRCCKRQ